jgi:hypothetical protein
MVDPNYSNNSTPSTGYSGPLPTLVRRRDAAGFPYMDPEAVIQPEERESGFPDLVTRAEHPDQIRFL